jgi:hypothetical protein
MLSVNSYTKDCIDECRAKVDQQISSYARLFATSHKHADTGNAALKSAIESSEPYFLQPHDLGARQLFTA